MCIRDSGYLVLAVNRFEEGRGGSKTIRGYNSCCSDFRFTFFYFFVSQEFYSNFFLRAFFRKGEKRIENRKYSWLSHSGAAVNRFKEMNSCSDF